MSIPFYSDCVNWSKEELPALLYLVDEGVEVTRETFRRRVRPPTVNCLEPGIYPPGAWHVHYFRLPGHPVYWYTWSAIEYVFATPEAIAAVQTAWLDRECA